MICGENEYKEAARRLAEDREFVGQQRAAFEEAGLTAEEIERGLEPALSFHAQLAEEVAWYERVKRFDFDVISNLTEIGRLLITVRIARNISQKELADALGVSEAQVSRDERNEYHGIGVERTQRILDALGVSVTTRVEEPIARLDSGRRLATKHA